MSFFQNPFAVDFQGAWVLSDRQYAVDLKCPRNYGRGDELVTVWATGPYNLSGSDSDGGPKNVLNVSFALNDYKNWTPCPVTLTGATSSAVTPQEVVTSLMASPLFADYFVARLDRFESASGANDRVVIRQLKDATRFRFYVLNTGAETVLLFNKKASVAELPAYFDRHTVNQRFAFADAQNTLVRLLPASSNVDAAVINNAVDPKGNPLNLTAAVVRPDWLLAGGRSGLFTFRVNAFDGSNRVTQMIEYPGGAVAGDMGLITKYTYTGGNTSPTTVAQLPYVLQSADLFVP